MRRLAMIFLVIATTLGTAVPALAQGSGKVWRLGVLTLPTSTTSPVFETFRSVVFPELAKQGYVEGSNLVVEIRVGAPDKLPELARELVATRPDAVIAVSSWGVSAAQQASHTTPIVGSFIGVDPIAAGFATSFARPGSNITGVVMLAPELDGKRVDVLHQTVPWARRIAALARSKHLEASNLVEMEKAATQADLELLTFYAATPEEFPSVFAKMREAGVEALAISSVPEFAGNAATLAAHAIASRLPTVCEWDWMAQEGCLLGYGPDLAELRRRTADYVVRIFGGAAPGELPMEQPTHFKFTVNLKTAKELGLTIPPAILARADEVIE
jgi:putative tryptophan/tyrosine transport system substrate-binding protein